MVLRGRRIVDVDEVITVGRADFRTAADSTMERKQQGLDDLATEHLIVDNRV